MIRLSFETSGTTGEPKRVEHTLDAMMANAEAFNKAAGIGPDVRMYHCLPRGHMAGFLNTVLCPSIAGGTTVYGPVFGPQSMLTFWGDVIGSMANAVWITPTIAAALVRLDRGPGRQHTGALEHVFCGTAPLPRHVREQWLDTFGIPLQESYGTSELMLVSVQTREQALTEHNCGSLLPGASVHEEENGELLVHSSYSAHHGTGDIGGLRNDRLVIAGRLKDVIIRGGFNVPPVIVEEAVCRVRGVRVAAVIGDPHEFWGERIVVFSEGGDSNAIKDFCRAALPKSHWPDEVIVVDCLPRNEMGKVLKSKLRGMIPA